jgi:hypothetical protein
VGLFQEFLAWNYDKTQGRILLIVHSAGANVPRGVIAKYRSSTFQENNTDSRLAEVFKLFYSI